MQIDTIMHGDCLSVLRTLPDASVDAIVTDPPSGIHFMGKSWDHDKGGRDAWVAWLSEVMRECRRVIKPGGHALVWALPRTSHWTGTAIEDAGWEVRDCVYHVFGSGFPKSADISKHIDKAAGARRKVVGRAKAGIAGKHLPAWNGIEGRKSFGTGQAEYDITAPATDAAKQWDGWGTALKPAVENWWLCRAPLSEGTVAANVLRWGTGALNIEASRVSGEAWQRSTPHMEDMRGGNFNANRGKRIERAPQAMPQAGRWPPHLLLSHSLFCTAETCADGCPVAELGRQSGERKASHGGGTRRNGTSLYGIPGDDGGCSQQYYDTGTCARYFPQFRYVAKASRSERNRGCEGLPQVAPAYGSATGDGLGRGISNTRQDLRHGNGHPTVKPLALMRWLITLITPPGGIVLDPFAGSGTTLLAAQQLGMHWLGIEQEREYIAIARARLGMREEATA